MNERELRIFYRVAQTLNMTEVSKDLYMTQPAVSQTIRELENELGNKLFDRIGKKLFLTRTGAVFFSYVRRILNLYDECRKSISDMNELKTGQLKIGASTTIGIYILTDVIGRYTRLNTDIDVSIIIENTKNIADLILENKIDFAFVEGPVHAEEIIVEPFCDDELTIITHPSHPWANAQIIDIQEIQSEKFIMRESGSGTREVFEEMLNNNGINLNIGLELGNTEAIKKAVEVGLGVSCLSKRAVQSKVQRGQLAAISLNGIKISRKLNLIYHRDKYLSNLFKHFIEFAKNNHK